MEKQQGTAAEPKGLRLLKESRQGLFRLIFSRMTIVLVLLLFNFGILFAAFGWFEEFLPHIYGGTALFTAGMVLFLMNSTMDPTAKLTWLTVMALLPVFGSLLYLFTCADWGHRAVKRRLQRIYTATPPAKVAALEALQQQDGGAAAMTRYVTGVTGIPVYRNTAVRYFPCGETMLPALLRDLEQAQQRIYLEFFIIDEGEMWGQILEVLAKKASAGVEVRVMYDGTCEFMLLPKGYRKKLKALGIDCRVFAPVTPFVSTHYNYRDHRKIVVVDGAVAYTGGINLADEYINAKPRYGYWKDTAVRLEGEAVAGLERMFLQLWCLTDPTASLPAATPAPAMAAEGFVMPYYEDPLDGEHVGRQVYIDLLNRAQRYVHIMTPYLILDNELQSALTYAAKRGVEVALVLPGIPDKKLPYALAKSHYAVLTRAGVKLYEYTPGFVHAKVAVADGREGVVGTINWDYRSLYHHFECAAYINGVPCLAEIEADLQQAMAQSRPVTAESMKGEALFYKAAGPLLKVLAPLL